jgi:hypothetical protein
LENNTLIIKSDLKNRLENAPKSEFIEDITGHYRIPRYKASITLPMENPMMISVRNYGA